MDDFPRSLSVLSSPPRVQIGDIAFDRVTRDEAVERIVAMARRRDGARYVCTGNLDHLHLAEHNLAFRGAYERADLVVADGAPVLWLSHLLPGLVLPERVCGSDLFWDVARASATQGLRLFLLGGSPGSAARAADAIERRHPGARVVGTYCPPFETFATEAEQARIREVVRAANPDVLLVAFGAPKQEIWIADNKDKLGVPLSIGVGGTFEMAAGVTKRAPTFYQRAGLEWLYRFAQEPKRLFRRYFVNDVPTLFRLAGRAVLPHGRVRASAQHRNPVE